LLSHYIPHPRSSNAPVPSLTVQLVGTNPLWGHVLWNAGVSLSDYFLAQSSLGNTPETSIKGSTVLELGAGGGLPSLVCGVLGAGKVVVTDYPEDALLDNLRWNVSENGRLLKQALQDCEAAADDESAEMVRTWGERMVVAGHLWGKTSSELLDIITDVPTLPTSRSNSNSNPPPSPSSPRKYDILILSDLIFNHSQHLALLQSCEALITPRTGKAYVFHSHHLPQYYLRDLGFFQLAQERGWVVRRVVKEHRGVMFQEDQGDEEKRATVWGWEMRYSGKGEEGRWDREEHSEGLGKIMEDEVKRS
jgi:nicotinamide N-methyltransferase